MKLGILIFLILTIISIIILLYILLKSRSSTSTPLSQIERAKAGIGTKLLSDVGAEFYTNPTTTTTQSILNLQGDTITDQAMRTNLQRLITQVENMPETSITSTEKNTIKNFYNIASTTYRFGLNYNDIKDDYKTKMLASAIVINNMINTFESKKNHGFTLLNDSLRWENMTKFYLFLKNASNKCLNENGELINQTLQIPGTGMCTNIKQNFLDGFNINRPGNSTFYNYDLFQKQDNKYYIVMGTELCTEKIISAITALGQKNLPNHLWKMDTTNLSFSQATKDAFISDDFKLSDGIQDNTPYNCESLRYYLFTLSPEFGGSSFLFDAAIKIPSLKLKLQTNYKLSNFKANEDWKVELTNQEFDQLMNFQTQKYNAVVKNNTNQDINFPTSTSPTTTPIY